MKTTLSLGFTTETLYEANSTRVKRICPVLMFPFFIVEKKVGHYWLAQTVTYIDPRGYLDAKEETKNSRS